MRLKVEERSREVIRIAGMPNDARDKLLVLRVSTPPRVGRIMRGGAPVAKISVQDLKQGLVYYEHTGKETGLQVDHDLFNLTLSNQSDVWIMAGNRYKGK